ncbi:3-oxoacyl-(acyl-carrier-protein) synthase-like protein [Fulvivirga imtechensis AK7]|uniref:3-oxoacyl-(Acyl-carrier-protein) synthase-like protein n=1 Tax=Fulvivirga imtechensis AK7 TaxID=1237149 RepID=L8JUS4_9BACT|nr:beta-ketoacyl synthase chain length factor [Fulvivirga imtechensis]ELR71309.1 3-oxoacyl-(acyl-carrier-protein) synthase-like protein [Fulvivirga imtechensis AK7]
MKGYISGTAAITPQHTFDTGRYLEEWVDHQTSYLSATEPAYREIIDPKLLRRMSRIIKMSVASAYKAMQMAKVEIPGAVIVGTGLGCVQDTEKFLKEIIDNEEGILSPTAFIQSTHNTIAGQIALMLQCPNHNFTFSNRGHSFENALEDALLQLQEGVEHVLVGGADEITPIVHELMGSIRCVSINQEDQLSVLGEGAAFFILTKDQNEQSFAAIEDTVAFNNPLVDDVRGKVVQFLDRNELASADIDLVLMGHNGVADGFFDAMGDLMKENAIAQFKNISGESFTASAYGHHLAAVMLQKQQVFQNTLVSGKFGGSLDRILLYNHYKGVNHTLTLLSKCPS